MLGVTIISFLVGAPLALGINVTYFVGRRGFIRILKESAGPNKGQGNAMDKRYARLLSMIRNTSSVIIAVLSLLFIIVIALIPISFNWQEYGRDEQLSWYPSLFLGVHVLLAIGNAAVLNYIRKMLATQMKKVQSTRGPASDVTPSYRFNTAAVGGQGGTSDRSLTPLESMEESI